MTTYKNPHEFLLARIKELEGGAPDRDGFDDAYIEGYRFLAHEHRYFNGWGDGGLLENYKKGLQDAIEEIDKWFKEYEEQQRQLKQTTNGDK